MKPFVEFTGPLNVVFAIVENLRVIAHPCIVSITSARSVDTSKKFLDVFEYYPIFSSLQVFSACLFDVRHNDALGGS
jgi:hypothetical protein